MNGQFDADGMRNAVAAVPQIGPLLKALPQRGVIPADRLADFTVQTVDRFKPQEVIFHFKRLFGFGGSEMAEVLKGSNPKYSKEQTFGDLQTVVRQKLMLEHPMYANKHMRRGNELESLGVAAMLLKAGAVIDHDAHAAIQSAAPNPATPWLVGNPDLIMKLPGGERVLVDIKSPNLADDSVEFQYECQTHHYRKLAHDAGFPIDAMFLGKLDLAPEVAASMMCKIRGMDADAIQSVASKIVELDMPGFGMRTVHVPYKPELEQDLIEAGTHAWNNFVLAGVVPKPKVEPLRVLTAEKFEQMKAQAQNYVLAKSLVKELNGIAKSAEGAVSEILQGVDPTRIEWEGALSLGQRKYAPEKMVELALEHGADLNDLQKPEFHVDVLVQEVERLGGNPYELAETITDATLAEQYLLSQGIDVYDPGAGVALRAKSGKKAQEEANALIAGAAPELVQQIVEQAAERITPKASGPKMG